MNWARFRSVHSLWPGKLLQPPANGAGRTCRDLLGNDGANEHPETVTLKPQREWPHGVDHGLHHRIGCPEMAACFSDFGLLQHQITSKAKAVSVTKPYPASPVHPERAAQYPAKRSRINSNQLDNGKRLGTPRRFILANFANKINYFRRTFAGNDRNAVFWPFGFTCSRANRTPAVLRRCLGQTRPSCLPQRQAHIVPSAKPGSLRSFRS